LSFLQALNKKYASDAELTSTRHANTDTPGTAEGQLASNEPIVISGKVVEEVGFDKIKQLLAAFNELRIVLLDGLCVAGLGNTPWPDFGALDEPMRDHYQNGYLAQWDQVIVTCPNITELDLSRNLLEAWEDVAVICRGLQKLEILKVKYVHRRDPRGRINYP
jgi:Leucine-rich repeat (LRR) protein